MITLGITGSFSDLGGEFLPRLPDWFYHDAAAALVVDGVVVAAVEEERLNRIKHTNKFPQLAIEACLEIGGVRAPDIDNVAFFFGEEYSDLELKYQYLECRNEPVWSARDLIMARLQGFLRSNLSLEQVTFIPHHVAHAYGTFVDSGFDGALVVVMDGNGETDSTSVFRGRGHNLELLKSYDISRSLGHFYLSIIPMLGFKRFDEYKVMGLAPYGDPDVYRSDFERYVTLSPSGEFDVDGHGLLEHLLRHGYKPRRIGEPIRSEDANVAAALQQSVEGVVLHVLAHWGEETRERRLCLSGGVAHNSSANGRLLSSGLFDDIFVHPASHDAGASIGAALALQAKAGIYAGKRLSHVFLGPSIGRREDVTTSLERWAPFIEWELVSHGTEEDLAAHLIYEDAVIGWARGRSEFGPRALGHRSILADPRKAENRDRVNTMVKKREEFRPFAPAVLLEHLETVFEMGRTRATLDFMSYVVNVREAWRDRLPAVVHIDGTARVQAVSREDNLAFWRLIQSFYERSEVPVLLNTSFNNFAEPIVQTTDDAIRCLATTALDALVLPGYVIRRRSDLRDAILHSVPSLHPAAELMKVFRPGRQPSVHTLATFHYEGARQVEISPLIWDMLARDTPGGMSLAQMGFSVIDDDSELLVDELVRLWERRLVDLVPKS